MTVVPSRRCLSLETSVGSGPSHNRQEGSPTAVLPPTVRAPAVVLLSTGLRCLSAIAQLSSAGWAIWAMAQMKPTISRAIAVVTTTFGLPAAARRR